MNFEKSIKIWVMKKVFFFLFLFLFLTNFILTQIHSELHLVIKFSQGYPTFCHWPPRDLIKSSAVRAAGLCSRNDAHFQKDKVVKALELAVPWFKIEADIQLINLINVFIYSWGNTKAPRDNCEERLRQFPVFTLKAGPFYFVNFGKRSLGHFLWASVQ